MYIVLRTAKGLIAHAHCFQPIPSANHNTRHKALPPLPSCLGFRIADLYTCTCPALVWYIV